MKKTLFFFVALLIVFLTFSAGCIFLDSSESYPTDTSTKLTYSLTGNQVTRYVDTYPTMKVATVYASPAQIQVSFSNGYTAVVTPKEIIYTQGITTVHCDAKTGDVDINIGQSKSLHVPANGGGFSMNGDKKTTYKESASYSWEDIRVIYSSAISTLTIQSGKYSYLSGSTYTHGDGFGVSRRSSSAEISMGITQTKAASGVSLSADGKTATVSVKHTEHPSKYSLRKYIESVTLSWERNGKWKIVRSTEDQSTIDTEEISG